MEGWFDEPICGMPIAEVLLQRYLQYDSSLWWLGLPYYVVCAVALPQGEPNFQSEEVYVSLRMRKKIRTRENFLPDNGTHISMLVRHDRSELEIESPRP